MTEHQTSQKEDKTTIAVSKDIHSCSSPTSVLSTVPLLVPHSNTATTSTSTTTLTSLFAPPLDANDNFQLTPSSYQINLETFVQLLPHTIRENTNHHNSHTMSSSSSSSGKGSTSSCNTHTIQNRSIGGNNHNGNVHDPVDSLFRRFTFSKEDLKPFCFIDEHKNYTRNLIATDNETYTLLLLCWNPGKYSPIHDHPGDGCWMRVCQGCINEVQYVKEGSGKSVENCDVDVIRSSPSSSLPSSLPSTFTCTMDTTFEEGQQTFIHDNIGYHKVGNPSDDTIAISMHLYSPPISKCKIWMDETDASSPTIAHMCNYSEYGHRKLHK